MTIENAPTTTEGGVDETATPTNDAASTDQEAAPPPASWTDLGISSEVHQALQDLGYIEPMPVQAAVYASVVAGKDMMVQARTGTGKTAAFGIPIVEAQTDHHGPGALILTPTRELAIQVSHELGGIAKYKEASVLPIYGGAPIRKQIDALQAGVDIISGTPGRILDHIRRGTLDTSGIKLLVLDECDEMLSMGFQEEIEAIIDRLPPKESRQTLLFSATIPDAIERIAKKHLTDPEKVSLSTGGISVDEIDHGYYIVSGMARMRDLLKILKHEDPESAIIFCNTRDETSTVAKYLNRHGLDAENISSDLSQSDRERVMKRMRDKNLRFLVATDIAARGIDISDLPYVINYTFPESAEVYVHRTGRTGRAGKRGVALSLVGPREIGSFYYLKLIYKIQPEERDLPGNEVIAAALEGDKLRKLIATVTESPSDEQRALARRLLESDDSERVVAALLGRLVSGKLSGRKRADKRQPDESASPDRAEARGRDSSRERSDSGDSRRRSRRPRPERDEARDTTETAATEDGDARRRRRRRRPRDEDEAPRRSRSRARSGSEASEAAEAGSEAAPSSIETTPTSPAAATADAESGETGVEERVETAASSRDDKPKRRSRRSGTRSSKAKSEGEASESTEAKGNEVNGDDAVDKPEKPKAKAKAKPARKSRTRKSRADKSEDGKEFWEAWADEKNTRDDDSSETTEAVQETDEPEVDESVRLYVNVGKREEITIDDVRELLADGLASDAAERIGSIALRNTHCYVRVPEDIVQVVIDGAEGKSVKDRDLVVERARR